MNDYKRYYILYVDDEEMSLKYFQKSFGDEFNILTATNAADGLKLVQERGEEIGVLLTDQRMPGEKGLQLLERVRVLRPHMVRMMITAYADFGVTVDAVNTGNIFRYISKPIQIEDMRNTLRRACDYYMLQRERDELISEKLSVMQNMIIADRIISLGVIGAGLVQQLRNSLEAVRSFLHQTPATLRYEQLDINRLRDPAFWQNFHSRALYQARSAGALIEKVISSAETPLTSAQSPLPLLQQLISYHQANFIARGLRLQTDLPASLPPMFMSISAFSRMFELLLEDSIISLPPGATITLAAKVQLDSGGTSKVVFTLSDDTPGAPLQSYRSVFDPFVVSGDTNNKYGINLLGAFFLAYHLGGTVKATTASSSHIIYTVAFPLSDKPPASPEVRIEDFITQVLMNDSLWEKVLSSPS
jgi:two-component system probable response regulator PhcQ